MPVTFVTCCRSGEFHASMARRTFFVRHTVSSDTVKTSFSVSFSVSVSFSLSDSVSLSISLSVSISRGQNHTPRATLSPARMVENFCLRIKPHTSRIFPARGILYRFENEPVEVSGGHYIKSYIGVFRNPYSEVSV